MNYFDNPGGMIPTWLVNWAAKVGAQMNLLETYSNGGCTKTFVAFHKTLNLINLDQTFQCLKWGKHVRNLLSRLNQV